MQNQTLRRIAVWLAWLCLVRFIADLLVAQREWILRFACILMAWAIDPRVALWTFLVIAVGLLISWEMLSPSRGRK